MNTTNAEIAGKLDGMECCGIKVIFMWPPAEDMWVVRDQDRSLYFTPSDLLAFCRAVVERVDGKNKKLQKIFNALDNHLGDTDPDILEDATDEEICDEEPVFWAANEIAKILKENK